MTSASSKPIVTEGTWCIDFYANGEYIGTLDRTYQDDLNAGHVAHEKNAPSAGIEAHIRNADETPQPSPGDAPPEANEH